MAAIIPGEVFDASCSWSGYNHQGNLALYFAIKEILDIYEKEKIVSNKMGKEDFARILKNHFIELEYLEDFAIGAEDLSSGRYIYRTIHQVKNKFSSSLSDYKSALEGLIYNLHLHPDVSEAYLHTSNQINCKETSFQNCVRSLALNMPALNSYLKKIQTIMNDSDKERELIQNGSKASKILKDLKRINNNILPNQQNVHILLTKLEDEIENLIKSIRNLPTVRLDHISIYDGYEINGIKQSYCKVDQ